MRNVKSLGNPNIFFQQLSATSEDKIETESNWDTSVNSCVMKYALATAGHPVVDESEDVVHRWPTASRNEVISRHSGD